MAKTILVAGGNSGMGLETVTLLSEAGHEVICATRSNENLVGLPGVSTVEFDATSADVPVVEGDSVLLGMVTSADLITYLLDQY